MSSDQRRTRVGFIGAGGIADRHIGTLGRIEEVEIVGFADPDVERAAALASKVGARAYDDTRELLDREDLDAVYICVPPFAHGAPERAVIEAGLPFFVEKPLTLSLDDADEIAKAIESSGLVTGTGYHWRYLDTVEEARDILRDRPPQLVMGHWLDSTPPPCWWWRQDRSGGQIVEQATHIIDLARHLVGEIAEVHAVAARPVPREDFPGLDVATGMAVSLRFVSGAVGTLATTCLLRWNHRVGLHLFGDGLAVELTDHDVMIDVGQGRPTRHANEDPVYLEDRDFIDAVRGLPNRIRVPYAEALKTHRVALSIVDSARTGRAVRLERELEAANG